MEAVSSCYFEEATRFGGGEGLEAAVAYLPHLDVAGDVTLDALVPDGLLECGVEDGVYVLQGSRREPLAAALADRAAAGLLARVLGVGASGGVDSARAALAGGAELVQPAAHVGDGESVELLGAE
jgi:hypothetical protein